MYDHVFGAGVVCSSVIGENLFVLSVDSSLLKWFLVDAVCSSENRKPTCNLVFLVLRQNTDRGCGAHS